MPPNIDNFIQQELANAIKASNKKAFEILFKAEYENVRYFINYYVRNLTTAEDITQDTFETLWNMRDRIDSSFNIRSYLFKIAKNKSLNHLGTLRSRMTDNLKIDEINHSINALNDNYTISKIDSLNIERIISVTYEKLPELTRKVFQLSRDEYMTYEEIAKELNISIKKVEYNISKALKVFHKKLMIFR